MESRGEPPEARAESVLLVEDDDRLREVLAETLRTYGFKVLTANCRAEAERRLAREPVHLVVTDVHLPGNGLELVLRIAAEAGERTSVPVILISADDTPGTVRRAEELGAARYLIKPVSGRELRDTIREVQTETREGQPGAGPPCS